MDEIQLADGVAEDDPEGQDVRWVETTDPSTNGVEPLGDLRQEVRVPLAHDQGDARQLQSSAAEGNTSSSTAEVAGDVHEAVALQLYMERLELGGVHGAASRPAGVRHGVQQPLEAGGSGGEGAAIVAVDDLQDGVVGVAGSGEKRLAWVRQVGGGVAGVEVVQEYSAVAAGALDADGQVCPDAAGVALAAAVGHGVVVGEPVWGDGAEAEAAVVPLEPPPQQGSDVVQ